MSDTGPLNYAVLIECTHVLPAMYREVYIPRMVAAELRHARAPDSVRTWMSQPPAWLLEVDAPAPSALLGLDPGEAQAMALAQQLGAEMLIDDLKARRVAAALGLRTVGLLGLLRVAARRGLLDLLVALDRLEQTSFFISPDLLESLRTEERTRRGGE